MSNQIKSYSAKIGEEDIIIEAGKLAFQANGAVTVRQSDTIILATATMAQKPWPKSSARSTLRPTAT